MNLGKYNLILGSKSPRRSELLQKAGFTFEVRVIETDESFPASMALDKIAEHIAIQKSNAHLTTLASNELLITADTIVVYNDTVFGKPKHAEEAIETILLLANKEHLVYSGVCLRTLENQMTFSQKSLVKFGKITESEAIKYVKEFNPLDKAGSYGIQDWIGFTRVESIVGSYTNILGLPLSQTYDAILAFTKDK